MYIFIGGAHFVFIGYGSMALNTTTGRSLLAQPNRFWGQLITGANPAFTQPLSVFIPTNVVRYLNANLCSTRSGNELPIPSSPGSFSAVVAVPAGADTWAEAAPRSSARVFLALQIHCLWSSCWWPPPSHRQPFW